MHIDFWKLGLDNRQINAWFGGMYRSFFRALERAGAKVTLSSLVPDREADVLVVPVGGGQDRISAQAMEGFQKEDLEAIIRLIDAFIVKNRVERALCPV